MTGKNTVHCKVLFLTANPVDEAQLALAEECREVEQKIRAAEHRDAIELISKWAVRPDDLLQYLNQHRPHILHFSGHGSKQAEIMLQDERGNSAAVSLPALRHLCRTLKDNLRLVFLNACYSKVQAEAIVETVDCAIGMSDAIGDEAAIVFAASFYRALGFGRSVRNAYDQGLAALMLHAVPEEYIPALHFRVGVDVDKVYLVNEKPSVSTDKSFRTSKSKRGPTTSVLLNSLHQLPAPPATFTGREAELKDLLAKIQAGGVTITGLQGMGGVGKTTLAVVLADRLKVEYPDAQLCFNLNGASSQPRSPADALAHVIRGFHPEAKLPEKIDELRSLYLSTLHGKRALLLMDNAADREQVEPLLPPVGCLLLVTSRQHFQFPGLVPLDLGSLPREDAQKLVLRICPRAGAHAERIAELSGLLALALEANASALLTQPLLMPELFVAKLAKASERLKPVEAAFSVSFDLLTVELQGAWRQLAVFPGSFDPRAAAAVWELDEELARVRLTALIHASLVEHDPRSQRVWLHDLALLFANDRLNQSDRDAAQCRFAQHYCRVLAEADLLYLKGNDDVLAGLRLYDRERANIEAGWVWSNGRPEGDSVAAQLCFAYSDAGAYVLPLRQHARQRIEWLSAAVIATHRIGEKSDESYILGNLGAAYAALNETPKAIECFEQSLKIAIEIGDLRGASTVLSNLGLACLDLGETAKAIECFEQGLKIARASGDRRAEGNALGNLGLTHVDLGGLKIGVKYHEQALVISREIGDRRGEGNDLGNLGSAHAALGEPERAIDYFEQGLEIAREIGDRHGEGIVLGNLGLVYADWGQITKSIGYFEQSLAIACAIGRRCDEGNSLFNLALGLDKLEQRTEAIRRMRAALEVFTVIESPHAFEARAHLEEWRAV